MVNNYPEQSLDINIQDCLQVSWDVPGLVLGMGMGAGLGIGLGIGGWGHPRTVVGNLR